MKGPNSREYLYTRWKPGTSIVLLLIDWCTSRLWWMPRWVSEGRGESLHFRRSVGFEHVSRWTAHFCYRCVPCAVDFGWVELENRAGMMRRAWRDTSRWADPWVLCEISEVSGNYYTSRLPVVFLSSWMTALFRGWWQMRLNYAAIFATVNNCGQNSVNQLLHVCSLFPV